jgi:DNA-binding transcriptional ArsR family regulator
MSRGWQLGEWEKQKTSKGRGMEFSKTREYNKEAELFKVLGHPIRLKIAAGLSMCTEECNVKKIGECLGLPQSTVSQHLALLKNKGVIIGAREGTEVRYSVTSSLVKRIVATLEEGRDSGDTH